MPMPMPMPMPMLMLTLTLMQMQMQMLTLKTTGLITDLLIGVLASALITTPGVIGMESAYAPEGAPTDTSWTTAAAPANAPEGADTATLSTTAAAHANAPEGAATATTWTPIAASASPDAAGVCASPPTTPRVGTTTSASTTLTHGAARRAMAATGSALIINQLQVGWQEWFSGKLSPHVLQLMFLGPHVVIFLLGSHKLWFHHLT